MTQYKNSLKSFRLIVSFFIGICVWSCSGSGGSQSASMKIVQIGEPLATDFFDVTVEATEMAYKVNTGNQFTSLKEQEGHVYLLIKANFKNVDSESRMIDGGMVIINYNGKDYKFDSPEPIIEEGWGIFLDQINPLTSKITRLVYKLPVEIKGPAYYQPGRNSDGGLISLGEIK